VRLAIVGWATDSGVGREFLDAMKHLPLTAAFVIQNKNKKTRLDLLGQVPHHLSTKEDPINEMERFLSEHKPDTILTWEVPGSWGFPEIWKKHGIRWVHVVHWDWFIQSYYSIWKDAVLVAPNAMCQRGLLESYKLQSQLLSVPIDTDIFPFRLREKAKVFMSVYGYGGLHGRRGLTQVYSAWRGLANKPPLIIRAQERPYDSPIPYGVTISLGSTPEPVGLFMTGDVAVQLSRYEGVGITLLEAQSCGIPVITVDAAPMNELAPDLLVPVERTETIVLCGKNLTSYVGSSAGLTKRITEVAGKDISELSRKARKRVEETFSWNVLHSEWVKLLEDR